MDKKNEKVAEELLKMASQLLAVDEDVGEEEIDDPKFNEKLRSLRALLLKLGPKKRRRLQQFGIGLIRPNATVEDLIDAVLKVISG